MDSTQKKELSIISVGSTQEHRHLFTTDFIGYLFIAQCFSYKLVCSATRDLICISRNQTFQTVKPMNTIMNISWILIWLIVKEFIEHDILCKQIFVSYTNSYSLLFKLQACYINMTIGNYYPLNDQRKPKMKRKCTFHK